MSLMAHPSVEHITAVDTDPIAQAWAQAKLALAKSNLSKSDPISLTPYHFYVIEAFVLLFSRLSPCN